VREQQTPRRRVDLISFAPCLPAQNLFEPFSISTHRKLHKPRGSYTLNTWQRAGFGFWIVRERKKFCSKFSASVKFLC